MKGDKLTIHDKLSGDIHIDTDQRDKNPCGPQGSMECRVHPVFGLPLVLEILITPNGEIIHRGYEWDNSRGYTNTYLHISEYSELIWGKVIPTKEMTKTLSGLFSGRIKIDGLKIAVGTMLQNLCPIDLEEEEKRIGKKIYLHRRETISKTSRLCSGCKCESNIEIFDFINKVWTYYCKTCQETIDDPFI